MKERPLAYGARFKETNRRSMMEVFGFRKSGVDYAKLTKLFEDCGCLRRDQLKEFIRQAKLNDRPLAEGLLEHEDVPQDKALACLGQFYGVPVVTLRKRVISPYVLNLIPKEAADQHSVVVFKKERNVISVAMVDPSDERVVDFVKQKTGFVPQVYLASPQDVRAAIKKYRGELTAEFAKIIADSISDSLASSDSVEKLAQHVPIIKMVDTIIDRALAQNASDIHLEPTSEQVLIRFRVDGMLRKIVELPQAVLPPLVARLKLMANLKLDEYRLPQDGRLRFSFNERDVAIRISAIPTLHGTKMVLRLLDTKERQFTLGKLGLNLNDLATIKPEITKPHGMILVTGPTGSGKTTTLYSFLRLLHRENVNICTVEDPIEYGIEGINQMQINPTVGLTFAAGLRSLLRQDPDIVMVGEIRDSETAEMAINAAMTGHLVLSTLHTNSAFLAVQRLIEIGIQPFQVGSVVNVIVGQRLVRKICSACRERLPAARKVLEGYVSTFNLEQVFQRLQSLGLLPSAVPPLLESKLFHGKGCARCSNTGYQGRIGIYEVLVVNHAMDELITGHATAEAIKQAALKQGTLTMTEDGVLKVLQGLTTFEEVVRVTKE